MTSHKPFFTLLLIASGLIAGSAFAGPDWAAIERARAAKQSEQIRSPGAANLPQQTTAPQESRGQATIAVPMAEVASRDSSK